MSAATHARAAVWLSVVFASACLNPDTPTIDQKVDSLFEERIAPGAPGCAVGVSRGDTVLYTPRFALSAGQASNIGFVRR